MLDDDNSTARPEADRPATEGAREKPSTKEPSTKEPSTSDGAGEGAADQGTSTTKPAAAGVRTTRRRTAGRPAGPPAALSTDIFAAPEPAKAPRAKASASADAPKKKAGGSSSRPEAAAETGADSGGKKTRDQVEETADQQVDENAAAKGSGRTGTSRPRKTAVAFQAPETQVQPARPSADSSEDDGGGDTSRSERDDEAGEDGSAPKRRRRSRGGRRRNKGDDASSGDESGNDSSAQDAGDAGGTKGGAGKGAGKGAENGAKDADDTENGAGTRRRRRRARAGEDTAGSPDDPENTVVKVREGRSAEDEITGVTGSTRLEAKKQRRREGREAGRRRAPIVSEAEFLARRESVKREMVVRQHAGEGEDAYTQIAVLEDSVLVEHYVARESQTSLIGNVYLGKVQNVLPSMEAAFVDIGAGRNAVIYAGEVDWSGIENGKARKIEEALSPGQQILVQVTKDPVGQKGARLTSQISLPGRFLVYVPNGQTSGISRKLPDTERSRLKSLLKEVLPEDAGVIVRTAAEGATEEQLTRDVTALQARWEDISGKVAQSKAPQLLYAEPDLVIKVVRDLFNEDFASLVVEGPDAWDNISGYLRHVAPDLAERLSEWVPAEHDGQDSFGALRLDEQIHKALERKVWLPSGGSLVIDRTEAMTVVDVNTGKFTGSGGNLEETVTKNNLEAAEEIVRQLRLRDIGGIIVVDFIDMVLESNRELVLRRLVECLGRDRTRHQVAEVTSLGLVQMTRKRIGTGLLESFSTECEHCKGRGVVVSDAPVEPKQDDQRNRGRRGRGGGRRGSGSNGSGSNGSAEQSPGDKAEKAQDEKSSGDKAPGEKSPGDATQRDESSGDSTSGPKGSSEG